MYIITDNNDKVEIGYSTERGTKILASKIAKKNGSTKKGFTIWESTGVGDDFGSIKFIAIAKYNGTRWIQNNKEFKWLKRENLKS